VNASCCCRDGNRVGRYLLVIVQNYDHVGIQIARIIHSLVGHSTSDGSIANHGYDMVRPSLHITGYSHTEPGRNRSAAVASTEAVKCAFTAFRKWRETWNELCKIRFQICLHNTCVESQETDPLSVAWCSFVLFGQSTSYADMPVKTKYSTDSVK
jgi:hypothetical protein